MFEGLTGALSNMFSGGFGQGVKNLGSAMGTFAQAASGQNVSDEDKAKFHGLFSQTTGGQQPTPYGNGTKNSFDISEGITGKPVSSYFQPTEVKPTTTDIASTPSTDIGALTKETNKAGEFDIAKGVMNASPATAPTDNATNTTPAKKDMSFTEKLNKLAAAVKVNDDKRRAAIASIPMAHNVASGGRAAQGWVNPLAQRDFKSVYSTPTSVKWTR